MISPQNCKMNFAETYCNMGKNREIKFVGQPILKYIIFLS